MSDEMNEKLIDAAQTALAMQNACNLSGVLHAWADAQGVLRDACGGNAKAVYFRNAVNVMFMSKVASLMCVDTDCLGGVSHGSQDLFKEAYEWCLKITGKVK